MRIQFVLIPTEAKRLIAKSLIAMDSFQRALESGIVVIHPSSSTVFMLEELGIDLNPSSLWICGLTVPRGLCASAGILREVAAAKKFEPKKYSHQWVLRKGKLLEKVLLNDILQEMKPGDIYVKSPNALDPQGNAGVLFTARGAGTIGQVMKARKSQGFTILLPTGLEKLIPLPIKEVCAESPRQGISFCTGSPCGVVPIEGTVVTEIDAVRILTGAQAVPIAAGGVGGAEGSTVMIVKGEEEQVRRAAEILASIKGAALPELDLLECQECPRSSCHLSYAYSSSETEGKREFIPAAYQKNNATH
jgi:hypothetical protein